MVNWFYQSLGRTGVRFVGMLVLPALGCKESVDTAPPRTVRDTIADTIIVRSAGTGVWGAGVSLDRELEIGVRDGAPEYTFGMISDIAVGPHGHVYVFDDYAPALREYDSAGTYVRTYGRFGSGPGEYRPNYLGIAVADDGTVFQYDEGNSRINRYDSTGNYLDSRLAMTSLISTRSLRLDDRGEPYIRAQLRSHREVDPDVYIPSVMVRVTKDGRLVDTLHTPTVPGLSRLTAYYEPHIVWAMSPQGFMVAGYNETYTFTFYRSDTFQVRMIRDHTPVPLDAGERDELASRGTWLRRRIPQHQRPGTGDAVLVPQVKPAYRAILVGENGRIWVQRHVPSVRERSARRRADGFPPRTWVEPTTFDVFEEDGAFLGSLTIPRDVTVYVARDDQLWGLRLGSSEEQYVVRYRIRTD